MHSDLIMPETFITGAIKIGRYFMKHARAAYYLMGADEVTEQCKYMLRQLLKTKPATVTVRDIMRLCQRFHKKDEVENPLNRLIEYGYLREISLDYSGVGKPKSKTWEVNPATYI